MVKDNREDEALVRSIKSLPSKDAGTLRLFQKPDGSYHAYGEDALYVAQTMLRTTSTVKKIGGDNGLETFSLTSNAFSAFLRDAFSTRALKIEIYASSGRNAWKLDKFASPGNTQSVEELLGETSQKAVLISVKVQTKADQRTVGVSYIDTGSLEIGVSEFADNELLSNLESLAIQLGARECIVARSDSSKDGGDVAKVQDIMDRCGILVSNVSPSDFKKGDIEQDMGRLVDAENGELSWSAQVELNQEVAMAAASALLKYLDLKSNTRDYGKYKLIKHDLSQYMRLDSSALRALNLMPSAQDGSKSMSVYGLLNKCKTVAGSRLLSQWLKQPLMDVALIEQRHNLVEVFMEDSMLSQTLRDDHFLVVPDISKILRKFQRGTAHLEDIIRLYQLVIKLPEFISLFENISDDTARSHFEEAYTGPIRAFAASLEKFQGLVETTVDLDALARNEFLIKSDFDDRLKDIREKLDALRDGMNDDFIAVGEDLGMEPEKKLKLEQHRVYGWSYRLTRTDATILRSRSGYVELSTQKNGMYFLSRQLKRLAEEFQSANEEYVKTQSTLVKEVIEIAATFSPVLEKLSTVLAHMDVITSFAYASTIAPMPYCRPKMHPRHTGDTVLREARHPCMEAQDDVDFIPNDVVLKRGESQFLIITGPNMGGKSTYIRQIGVIALMAQIGCFVPCSSAELSIFDSILARVGAGDSQLKGISTFMAEMLETATILKSATRESLIVIDELGRGTSTYDGFGLAWAISEHIVKNIGCFALFATHFHELTALADSHPGIANLHVVAHVQENQAGANERDITLLYKVEPGVSDQSFGIHVAEAVKFPSKVVKMAKRKAAELEDYEHEDDDDALRNISKKMSREEVRHGSDLLRSVLKEWAKQDDGTNVSSSIEKLKMLVDENSELKKDKFVNEVLLSL